jgi:hypothetical protein
MRNRRLIAASEKPSNIGASGFGKLFSRTADGDVFAQPLYVPSLAMPGLGKRNVVFAATGHDSVYTFDVNGIRNAPLWKTSFVDPQRGISTLSEQDVLGPFITPEVGITPTPVIDAASRTMYVLAWTKEHGVFVQKPHALDITNGKEMPGAAAVVDHASRNSSSDYR